MIGATSDEKVFRNLTNGLDSMKLKYDANYSKQTVSIPFSDDETGIVVGIMVNNGIMHVLSYLDITVPEDRTYDALSEINRINVKSTFGYFTLDPESMIIGFEYLYIYKYAKPPEELILDIVKMVMKTIAARLDGLKELAM